MAPRPACFESCKPGSFCRSAMVEYALATACVAPATNPVTVADTVANGCSCTRLFGITILPLIEAN